jgi:hypothetical protein
MTDRQPEPENEPIARRKPYASPRILSREPLEAMANICRGGTAKANPGTCRLGPINS